MAGVQAKIRTFITPPAGPGRTSPSILEDLSLYDPLHSPPSGFNILRDSCLSQVHVEHIGQLLPPTSCRHAFATKEKQSQLPALDERPSPKAVYTVSSTCQKCRIRVQLKVDYSIRWEVKEAPCPNSENPQHHLVASPWREDLARSEWQRRNPGARDEIYVFECSSTTCSATVTIRIGPPMLSRQDIHVLTDKELLRQRTEEAFRTKSAQVEGMAYPTPRDVLHDLRQYMRNAWAAKEARTISVDNKRFLVRFGPDGAACKDVLESLRFKFKPGEGWVAPVPNADVEVPLQGSLNSFLDDVDQELTILLVQKDERQLLPDNLNNRDAFQDFSRALGCQDYDKAPFFRTATMEPELKSSCYTALGVPMNASDELILYAYDGQTRTDPLRAPWYFSYLQQVQKERPSEALDTKIAMEISAGKFTAEQLEQAYQYFGLSFREQPTEDDYIVGVFWSRLQDAPRQEIEMREQLRMIGSYRQSTKIIAIANDTLETYEQALAFLGAEPSVSDEFIPTLYTSRTVEDSSLKEKALKAVRLIAENRKSQALTTWLQTGNMEDTTMGLAEAYSALEVPEDTTDEMILSVYVSRTSDQFANSEYYNKALVTIADHRQSPELMRHLRNQDFQPTIGKTDIPVGLENIGNTCYLNSLLQFFFTLPELRNIVLDFDRYKMDPTPENMSKKRVGSRRVTVREVLSAQRFVTSLAVLFQDMITSSQPSITPQQELARLTLENDNAKKRRSTIMSGGRPSLGNIDSMPVQGPLLPTLAETNGVINEEAVQSPAEMEDAGRNSFLDAAPESLHEIETLNANALPGSLGTPCTGGNSSEATLVSRPSTEDLLMQDSSVKTQQQQILDNKENLSPIKDHEEMRRSESPDKGTAVLGEVSSSVLNSQAGTLANKPDLDNPPNENGAKGQGETASKPPPIPPRPAQQPQPTALATLEEYARQQDVTEVISHCLFQFSCAMRPTGTDKSGEQLDEIHDLFYGQLRWHYEPKRPSSNALSNFPVIFASLESKPRDIYAALDSYFDKDLLEDGTRRFASITQLPPVFSVQFTRVEFNKETKTPQKSNHHVELMETIYLDRYLEEPAGSEQMMRREETWTLKEELTTRSMRLRELDRVVDKQGREIRPDVPTLLERARFVLESLQGVVAVDDDGERIEIDPRTIETLEDVSKSTRKELDETSKKTADLQQSVLTNFADMRNHGYRLHAVFFHHGTQGSGHYWIYMFDFKKEIWRKYNDGYVTEVHDINEIFGKPSDAEMNGWGGPANPYFLVYVRAGEENRLVECVRREIVQPPPGPEPAHRSQMTEMPPEAVDVEMQEGISYERPSEPVPHPAHTPTSYLPSEPLVPKVGEWDSREPPWAPDKGW